MGIVTSIALHDVRRLLNDRSGLMWTFLMPLVFAGFFGVATGGGSHDPTQARAYLTVVDEDGGPLASSLLTALESQALTLNPIDPEAKDRTEDKVRTLVIPAGFSLRVAAGEPVALRLEKDPDTNAEAALVAEARIRGAISHLIAEMALYDAGADESLPRDPLVRLDSRYAGQATIAPSGFSQSIPGQATFFVMMVALTYGAATLTQERRAGTLRRLATTPASHGEIVLGKLIGRLAVSSIQIVFFVGIIFLARRLLGLDMPGSALAVGLVLLVYAIAVAPLGVLFGGLVRDPDQAANLGIITTMVLAGLGGCWWPIEVTPPGMQTLARFLPTGWAMDALNQLIAFGHGLEAVVVPLTLLLGFSVVCSLVAARLLRLH